MENKSDKNNVHFYVARDKKGALWLYLKKPVRSSQMFLSSHLGKIITKENYFSKYGLNKNDFDNIKWEDEPIEVFLNIGD